MNEQDIKVLETAWAISLGYDGFNNADDLKGLIDEIRAHIQIVLAERSNEFINVNKMSNDNSLSAEEFIDENMS